MGYLDFESVFWGVLHTLMALTYVYWCFRVFFPRLFHVSHFNIIHKLTIKQKLFPRMFACKLWTVSDCHRSTASLSHVITSPEKENYTDSTSMLMYRKIFNKQAMSQTLNMVFRGPLWHFVTCFFFYGGELLASRPTPKLEGHPLSAVRDCLFNIFAATLHIWRPSPPSATWGRAMPWWQGTHLTWSVCIVVV
jgi:hypothetical protein